MLLTSSHFHLSGRAVDMRVLNKTQGYTRVDKNPLDNAFKPQALTAPKRWHINACLLGYVVTAILQTSLVDYLRVHDALGRKTLLLPTMANTLGMMLCGFLMGAQNWRHGVRRVTTSLRLRRWVIAGACES